MEAPKICFGQNIPDLVRLTTTYVKNEDFENLSSLYLLPPYYSESKRNEEREGIKKALYLLSNEFGSITRLNLSQEKAKWLNLEIFGGDVDFVRSNPRVTQFVLRSSFSILGNGFIIIRVYENDGNPKLRSVGYALPDSPQSKDEIKRIGKKLIDLMNQ